MACNMLVRELCMYTQPVFCASLMCCSFVSAFGGRRGKKSLLAGTPFFFSAERTSPVMTDVTVSLFFIVSSACSPDLLANLNAANVASTMTLSRPGGSSRNQSICAFSLSECRSLPFRFLDGSAVCSQTELLPLHDLGWFAVWMTSVLCSSREIFGSSQAVGELARQVYLSTLVYVILRWPHRMVLFPSVLVVFGSTCWPFLSWAFATPEACRLRF